jgi:hypothetical protein
MQSHLFDTDTVAAVEEMAKRIKVEPASLLAVAEVESAGQVTALVKGRPEPLIRWEGHYYDRLVPPSKRAAARKAGLASSTAGAVKNPNSQAARWEIVRKAAAIDRQAALESISIGLGQVMGAHWQKLGFASVDDMVKLARENAAGQIAIMVRYIEKFGLTDELQRGDFAAFARGYNGPGYKKNAYDRKMAAAYQRYTGKKAVSAASGMLRMGSSGAKVRELQALLVRAGYAVTVDGDYGPATRDAVKDFQKAQKVTVDGVAGPETFRMLEAFKRTPDEQPGQQGVTETPEATEAAKGGGLVVLVIAARDQIAETAGWLTGVDMGTAQTISNWLMAGSGLIGVGLAGWAVWGWIKSRRTDEGDVDVVDEIPVPDADTDEVLV